MKHNTPVLRAMRDEVIIEPVFEEFKGSLIIPESAKEFKQYHGKVRGRVISVGPRYPYRDDLRPGDAIVFMRNEGKPVRWQGKLYLVLRERWVEGVDSDAA